MSSQTFKTFITDELDNRERSGLLASAIAPRPICFASTIDKSGKVNLSPYSYFNVFSSTPPVMVFSPIRRGRDGTTKHTYENLLEVPEVAINVVNYAMVEQMSLASTEYDKGVNEFVKAGFTELASETIKPPRVAESPISFECTVDDIIELGTEGGSGSLVLSRVKRIHINTDFLTEDGNIDPAKLDLVGRMGGSWYSRASGDSLFEIPKPLRNKGIGFDQLPESIRKSTVLNGNNLGRLANMDTKPGASEIDAAYSEFNLSDLSLEQTHQLAKGILESGDTKKALAILFAKADV